MARKKKVQYSEKVKTMAHEWNMFVAEFADVNMDLYMRYVNLCNRMNSELTLNEYAQMQEVVHDTAVSTSYEYYEKKAQKNKEEA